MNSSLPSKPTLSHLRPNPVGSRRGTGGVFSGQGIGPHGRWTGSRALGRERLAGGPILPINGGMVAADFFEETLDLIRENLAFTCLTMKTGLTTLDQAAIGGVPADAETFIYDPTGNCPSAPRNDLEARSVSLRRSLSASAPCQWFSRVVDVR